MKTATKHMIKKVDTKMILTNFFITNEFLIILFIKLFNSKLNQLLSKKKYFQPTPFRFKWNVIIYLRKFIGRKWFLISN